MRRSSGWIAAAAYTVISAVMTWPLARSLTRDVASDLGDSLYYMWAVAWDCKQILAILGGDFGRVRTFFDANMFYPEPLSLVYSDHMLPQAIQVLPLYITTGNLILCYNLLVLSTFILSGLGTYLFVRELTGNARAAFIAGLVFAFAPYRMGHAAHLNLLSVQWVPFALYGLRRYFDTGGRVPLAGAVAAVVVQNLSSGYYLLYFMPFVAAYALWEIYSRDLWSVRKVWGELAVAATVAALATAPFLVPYFLLRTRMPALRSLREVSFYSADVYAYLTAPPGLRFWGHVLRMFPGRPEGELFPGLLPIVFAAVGVMSWARPVTSWLRGNRTERRGELARAFLYFGFGLFALAAVVVLRRRLEIALGPLTISANSVTRLVLIAAAALAIAIWLSPALRAAAKRMTRAPETWGLFVLVGAWWLSLGPAPMSSGRPLDIAAPYAFLFEHVPGFEGTRVPARFAMIVAFAFAVLAAFGLRAIDRGRWAAQGFVAVAVVFLAEVSVLPFPLNVVPPLRTLVSPEPRIYLAAEAPRVYSEVRRLPPDAVLAEFPLGESAYDRRAMYYSTLHWRQLMNGYSGFTPPSYIRLGVLLADIPGRPDVAWAALREWGATHTIVHEAAYLNGQGAMVSAWMKKFGAVEIFREGSDVLFALPASTPAS
jgi:hypothetical protein